VPVHRDRGSGRLSRYIGAVGSLWRRLRPLWGRLAVGQGSVGRASMVTCECCRGRLPKRFSDRWVLWHFRPVLYSKRPQRSRKPWKAGVNRVESSRKPLGSSQKPLGLFPTSCPGHRRGEEGTGRAVDLSGCHDRLARFVHSITTHPSLRSRMHAQDQAGRFSAGAGSGGRGLPQRWRTE
jgi:hypothetical protein